MQNQYSVEYVGAQNLPSQGLDYRFPKIGKVLKGHKKVVFLTEDRYVEARKLPGLEVKPTGTAEIEKKAAAHTETAVTAPDIAVAYEGTDPPGPAAKPKETKTKKRGPT